MNKIKNLIQKQREEFDEKYKDTYCVDCLRGSWKRDHIKSHHTLSTIKLLEGLKEEVKGKEKSESMKGIATAVEVMIIEQNRVFNSALQDFQKLLSDTIKEMKGV